MLTLVKKLGILNKNPDTNRPLKHPKEFGIFICPNCSKEFASMTNNVFRGKVTQCKPCSTSLRNYKHGGTPRKKVSPLYRRWLSMKDRCTNPNNNHYRYYGAKGIEVCSEWLDFSNFRNWAEANGYNKELSLDRINPDGNYEPINCRYVSAQIQGANKDKTKSPTKNSAYKGVYKIPSGGWYASICINYEQKYLGSFETQEEAAKAYNNYVLDNNLPHRLNKGL